jgi:AcrR family transcriptional regulator
VPAARVAMDRSEKLGEILDDAEARLLDGGYNAMSVAAIARDLGISQNTIYWYFPSKDELLAATARRLFERDIATKPSTRGELAKILWTAEKMHELASLRTLINARGPHSATVENLGRELDSWIDTLLTSGLRRLEHPEAHLAAVAFRATVEGTVVLGLTRIQRRKALTWALETTAAKLGATVADLS